MQVEEKLVLPYADHPFNAVTSGDIQCYLEIAIQISIENNYFFQNYTKSIRSTEVRVNTFCIRMCYFQQLRSIFDTLYTVSIVR